MIQGHAIDQVDLGTDRDARTGRGLIAELDDKLGRTVGVGQINDLRGTLGMNDYLHTRVSLPHLLHVIDREIGMHVTVPLPEDQFGPLDLILGQPPEIT